MADLFPGVFIAEGAPLSHGFCQPSGTAQNKAGC